MGDRGIDLGVLSEGRSIIFIPHANRSGISVPIAEPDAMTKLTGSFYLMIIALAGCSGVNVLETKADKNFQLNRYKTFDFFKLEASGDTAENFSRNVEILKEAITRELESKGLRRSSSSPDLLANIGMWWNKKFRHARPISAKRLYT